MIQIVQYKNAQHCLIGNGRRVHRILAGNLDPLLSAVIMQLRLILSSRLDECISSLNSPPPTSVGTAGATSEAVASLLRLGKLLFSALLHVFSTPAATSADSATSAQEKACAHITF